MKELKGVISNWRLDQGRIHGTCVKHTTYQNGIEDNQPIITSQVIAIQSIPHSNAKMCTTNNSIYLLI